MRTVEINKVIDESKFNGFFLTVLFLCSFAILGDGYDLVVYGTVVPTLIKEWNITPIQAGTLGSYALFGMMLGALFFAPLSDKIGKRKVVIFCVAMYSLASGLCGLTNSPNAFGICRFFAGLGLGGVMPLVTSLITEYSPKKLRTTFVAIVFCMMQVGAMSAAGLAIVVIPHFGWQVMFFIGLFPLLALPLYLAKLPETMIVHIAKNDDDKIRKILVQANPDYKPEAGERYSLGKVQAKGSPVGSLFADNRSLSTIMIWTIFFMNLLETYALQTWLPKLMQSGGYSVGSSLWFMIVLNLGAMAGGFIGGVMMDRIKGKIIIVGFYIVAIVTFLLLSIKSSMVILSVLIFLAGATTMGTEIIYCGYVSQYYPINISSTGMGWGLGVGRVGGMLGPLLIGVLLSLNFTLAQNFMAMAIPSVIALIAFMVIQEKYSYANIVAVNHQKQEGGAV